ncbi:MAG: hypothetical protein KQJ78_23360 [Deltaproteobacteria bacterium]|nr:hypothetical protein [Deltaproteobacteria bacterium]
MQKSRAVRGFLRWLPAAAAVWLFLAAWPALAQSEMTRWMGPELGQVPTLLHYQGEYSPEAAVAGQGGDFRYSGHRFSAVTPLWQDPDQEMSVQFLAASTQVDTSAVLPDSGTEFPDSWWDLRLSGSYRWRDSRGWIWGGNLQVGSASDEPFQGEEEISLGANALVRIPSGEDAAWIFFVNYNNRRDFLSGAPIPGAAYWYRPSEKLVVVAGLPFLEVTYRPWRPLGFSLQYFFPRSVRAAADWRFLPGWQLSGGFSWKYVAYFRAERTHAQNRLFFYQKRLFADLAWRVAPGLRLTLGVAWAFDREIFEGESYDDNDLNRLDLANGPIYQAGLSFRF